MIFSRLIHAVHFPSGFFFRGKGSDVAVFPELPLVISEEDRVFAPAVVLKKGGAHCGSTNIVQRSNVKLHDGVIVHTAHFSIKVFAGPCGITDVSMSAEMGTDIPWQGKQLPQKVGGTVSSGKCVMGKDENRLSS